MSSFRPPNDKRISNVPSLDGIKDPAIRAVLEPLVQGWAIRNGQSAVTTDYKFITHAELNQWMLDGTLIDGIFNGSSLPGASQTGTGAMLPTQARVNKIVDDWGNKVRNSAFFQYLGQRIDKVELPLKAMRLDLDKMQTATYEEATYRYNVDNAIVHTLNQVFAGVPGGSKPTWVMTTKGTDLVVNNLGALGTEFNRIDATANEATATVKEEIRVRAEQTGILFGEYSVKIDLNGYVAGFGLSSTVNADQTKYSEFYVRADCFAVGSPTSSNDGRTIIDWVKNPVTGEEKPIYGPAPQAAIPFIVDTNTQYYENNGQPITDIGGVYITNAFIKNGDIGHAKIGFAEIDALLIGGKTITIPYSASGGSRSVGNAGATLCSISVFFDPKMFPIGLVDLPSSVVIGASFYGGWTGGASAYDIHGDLSGGSASASVGLTLAYQASGFCTLFAVDTTPVRGMNTYYLTARTGTDVTATITASSITMFAMGTYR
jgi:hypothetical protein